MAVRIMMPTIINGKNKVPVPLWRRNRDKFAEKEEAVHCSLNQGL